MFYFTTSLFLKRIMFLKENEQVVKLILKNYKNFKLVKPFKKKLFNDNQNYSSYIGNVMIKISLK